MVEKIEEVNNTAMIKINDDIFEEQFGLQVINAGILFRIPFTQYYLGKHQLFVTHWPGKWYYFIARKTWMDSFLKSEWKIT